MIYSSFKKVLVISVSIMFAVIALSDSAFAASAAEIDARVNASLKEFHGKVGAA